LTDIVINDYYGSKNDGGQDGDLGSKSIDDWVVSKI